VHPVAVAVAVTEDRFAELALALPVQGDTVRLALAGGDDAGLKTRLAEFSTVLNNLATIWALALRVHLREAALSEAKNQAEAALAAREEFLATVSHELRTPLTSIIGYGEMVLEGDILRLPGHAVSLASDQSGLRTLMETTYAQAGFMPPTTKAFLEDNNLQARDVAQMYRLLMEEGVLVKISEEFYYARTAMDDIIGRVRGFFATNQEMGPQDFRDLTDLTRKFAIPVLEYLDKEKITMRIGDKRQIRKR